MLVEDIMRKSPSSIGPDAELGEARDLMTELDIRHVPVVKDEELVGILSDRDISAYAERTGESIWGGGPHPVSAAMVTAIATAAPCDSIADAMARMADDKIGCLPVVLGNKLVGIVTTTDLLAAQARALQD